MPDAWVTQTIAEICAVGNAARLAHGTRWWHWLILARDLRTVADQLGRPLLVLLDEQDIVIGTVADLTCAACGRVHRLPVCARACCTAQGDACDCGPQYVVVTPAVCVEGTTR